MIDFFTSYSAPLVATAAIFVLVLFVIARDSSAHHATMQRLKSAQVLLDRHLSLLEQLIASDAVPDALKYKLLVFSGTAADSDTFLALLREACEMAARPVKELGVFDRDLAVLYSENPELGSTAEAAVWSLFMGMVLSSEDAQNHLYEAFVKANPRVLLASAIEAKRCKDVEAGGLEGGMMPA